MKKLLFIISTLLIFSCGDPGKTIDPKAELPIEIVNLKEVKKYDTLVYIDSQESMYVFNLKNEYQGKLNKEKSNLAEALFWMFFISLMINILTISIIAND